VAGECRHSSLSYLSSRVFEKRCWSKQIESVRSGTDQSSTETRQDQLVHSITDALAATGAVRFNDIKRYLVERGAGLTSSRTGLQPVEVKTLQHFCQDGAVLRKKSTAELSEKVG
jgi:hypothetical protein